MNPNTRASLSKKVRKGRRARVGRSIGRRFLESYGLGGYLDKRSEEQQQAKGLGIFGEAAKKKVSKDTNLPPLDTPERVLKETTPSVSSIVKQLEGLLKAANNIGAISNRQQKTLTDQIKQAKRLAKEDAMESNVPAAVPEPSVGINGSSISPLAEIFTNLSKEIENLLGVIEEKNQEQQQDSDEPIGVRGRFLDAMGLEDYRKQRRKEYLSANQYAGFTRDKKLSSLSDVEKRTLQSRGFSFTDNNRVLGPDNKFASKSQIEGSLRGVQRSQLKRPGVLGRATDKVGGTIKSGATNIMAMIGKSPAAGAAPRGVRSAKSTALGAAAAFGSTVKKSAASNVKAVNLNAIKNAARPIITKALGKTAIKSIPILGAVAGLGFAVGRLLEGDPIGAGLEAASGLAGPVTAIPALVALTSRDIYANTFGVQPEQDPLVGTRMGIVSSAVKSVAESVLSDTVEPKSPPTSAVAEKQSGLDTLKQTQQQVSAASMTGSQAPSAQAPSNSPTGALGTGATDTGGSAQQATPSPAPSVSLPGGNSETSGVSGAPSAIPVTDDNPYPNAEDALKQKVEPTVGAAIAEASQLNENLAAGAPAINFMSGQSVPLPSYNPTSRSGAIGIGNVPNPTYGGAGDILTQLYFGAAA